MQWSWSFKRNPDAKWKLKPSLSITCKIQAEVLESYSKIVKPGGKIYATCSYITSENQEQIERFLTTDIGEKSLNLSKTKKYWLQNLVLTVLYGLWNEKRK
jgi:16S rRNA (cytosine967-C5)-methyltransferase